MTDLTSPEACRRAYYEQAACGDGYRVESYAITADDLDVGELMLTTADTGGVAVYYDTRTRQSIGVERDPFVGFWAIVLD